jgi:hypothetical protein
MVHSLSGRFGGKKSHSPLPGIELLAFSTSIYRRRNMKELPDANMHKTEGNQTSPPSDISEFASSV